jgi:hypothetical protein
MASPLVLRIAEALPDGKNSQNHPRTLRMAKTITLAPMMETVEFIRNRVWGGLGL